MESTEFKNSNLPNNFLAEKIILSTVLTDSQVIGLVLENLSVESFFDKTHKILFQAIFDFGFRI